MGSQLVKYLLAGIALAFVAVGCSGGNDESLNKAVEAPVTGKPGEGPATGSKPQASSNQAAGSTANAAQIPPGRNRDHP